MEVNKTSLYHIHRNGNMDNLWYVGSKIKVDDNFNSLFYTKLLDEEKKLIERYGVYDIDYIITKMEEIKCRNIIEDDMNYDFDLLLRRYYFLRREKALEEGRKIFNLDAPSRLHSIFLTDFLNKGYWISRIGDNSFSTFLLDLDGNLFVSSDTLFPYYKSSFAIQVEQSKKYWQPKLKRLAPHKEFLFQGECKIVR